MLNSNRPRSYGGRTKSFTDTDISAGYFGFFDSITTAGVRLFFITSTEQNSLWSGWVKGNSLVLRCKASASPTTFAQPFSFSVDGSVYASPHAEIVNSEFVIVGFSGLSDNWHFVEIKLSATAYNGVVGPFLTGDVFRVTGSDPSVSFRMGTAWMVTDPSFPGLWSGTFQTRTGLLGAANVAPTHKEVCGSTDASTPSLYILGEGIKIKAQCSEIWLLTGAPYVNYSIDGSSTLTEVDLNKGLLSTHNNGTARSWRRIAIGLDSTTTHDYYIYPGSTSTDLTSSTLMIAVDSSGTFSAISTTKRVASFGDSITQNQNYPGQPNSTHYMCIVASALGALAETRGKTGITVATLDTDLSSVLTAMGHVPDIAEIGIGRNDGATASAAFKTSLTNVINTILANGTNKVICRGVSLGGLVAGSPPARDQDISDAVAAIQASLVGAQAVVYVPTTGWTGITTTDTIHPTRAGYVTAAGYAITDYGATGFF